MMDKSKGELISDALVASGFTVVPWRERGNRERGQLEETANGYDKATAIELPPDILAFVAEVDALHKQLGIEKNRQSAWFCETCQIFNRQNAPQCSSCKSDCPELPALRERLAKLESLGPWIEVQRVAAQEFADNKTGNQRMVHAGRADAFSKVGHELCNRVGKLQKEPTNEPVV